MFNIYYYNLIYVAVIKKKMYNLNFIKCHRYRVVKINSYLIYLNYL